MTCCSVEQRKKIISQRYRFLSFERNLSDIYGKLLDTAAKT